MKVKAYQSLFNKLFFRHTSKQHHQPALDGLRGFAVLLVLLSHASLAKITFHPYLNVEGVGKMGVYLFFVLSAYLLDRQIGIAFRSGQSNIKYWLNYLYRRFLRIYPLFFVALVLHYWANSNGIDTVINTPKDILNHLLFLEADGIFWSIPVEFKYYLWSPLLLFFFHRVIRWNVKWMNILLVLLILISIGSNLLFDLPEFSTLRYLPFFIVGTYLALGEVTNTFPSTRIKSRQLPKRVILSLIALLGSFMLLYYFKKVNDLEINFYSTSFYLPLSLLWGTVLIMSKYGYGGAQAFFRNGVFRFFGVISYSIYLLHMPILTFFTRDLSSTKFVDQELELTSRNLHLNRVF